MTADLYITRVRPMGGATTSLTVRNGRIATYGEPTPPGAEVIDALAEARVHILTTAPASRPVPPVKRLMEAGVVVAAGSDGVRDTWGPYGNADMLERAVLVGLRNNFRRDDEVALALDTCTTGGARLMGLEGYGLPPGSKADLVLLDGETLAEAVVSRAPRRVVMKGGRVVARNGQPLVKMA